ncbi:MAG: hypothetical protein HND48_17200 [Chloroflexi bacterium]|nr:hypothetical protein [Chloroflexota bacterium]
MLAPIFYLGVTGILVLVGIALGTRRRSGRRWTSLNRRASCSASSVGLWRAHT